MARHGYAPVPDTDTRGDDTEAYGADSDDEGEDVLVMNTAGPAAPSPLAQAVPAHQATDRQVVGDGIGDANMNSTRPAIDTTILPQTSQAPLGYDYPPPGSPPASASRPFHSQIGRAHV